MNRFLPNVSPEWLEAQYLLWRESPEKVGPDWRAFFAGFDLAGGDDAAPPAPALKQSAVQSLIYRYRDIGHLMACTNPLTPCQEEHPLLSLAAFELSAADLDRTFHTRRFLKKSATLREILEVLQQTYCGAIGVEFMHIQDPEERQWLIDRMEPVRNRPAFPRGEKIAILRKLQEAALFEAFLHRRFLGQKRFSLEGGEVLIPVLDHVVRKGGGAADPRYRSRHVPPRPPQCSGQHLRQTADDDFRRVRGQSRARIRRRGGCQVSQGVLHRRYRR